MLRARLERAGLIDPSESKGEGLSLGSFLTNYFASRAEIKAGTLTAYDHARRNLLTFFGAAKPLAAITKADAEAWRIDLVKQQLSSATIRRRCGVARMFFKRAVSLGAALSNPFTDLVASVRANKSRAYYVSAVEAEAVLAACPNAYWRLLFGLARYGGVRIPSEAIPLRWSDVNWEHGKLTVHSPKTEHHPGRDRRLIPLFPELRPLLLDVFDQAPDGAEHIFPEGFRRPSTVYPGVHMRRIIERAGLKPWPKTWQNCRSTRQTELAQRFPLHVVYEWIGNT